MYLDFFDEPELAGHLFSVIAETVIRTARLVASRTGTNSIACNRSILNVDPRIFLDANCSVQMISPAVFRRVHLPHERRVARELAPFGVHHCGNNAHLFAADYRELGCVFLDVGWGSDVARVRRELPDVFLNLRLSPVRMLNATAGEIRDDATRLLEAAGGSGRCGVCCINMDYGTPEENVRAMLDTAAQWPQGRTKK